MSIKKMAACLTGAVLVALTLPLLVSAQTNESAAENTLAAQEAAKEPDQPQETERPIESEQPTESADLTPEPSPYDAETIKPTRQKSFALLLNGKDVSDGAVTLNWSGDSVSAQIQAVGPDGRGVSPTFSSSNPSVASVDASGLVSAIGCGVVTVVAKLDSRTASVQITISRDVERLVIIAEDTVSPGHSIKLRAFDQDGNRTSVQWHSSSDKLARVSEDGVLTARHGASGQSVDITAQAGEGSDVIAVKTIQIE